MSTTTATLADFILARLAEDEAVAKACGERNWRFDDGVESQRRESERRGVPVTRHEHVWGPRVQISAGVNGEWFTNDMKHIARHDPARVLADIEAKRRIVALCQRVLDSFNGVEPVLWPDVNRRERHHAQVTLDLLAQPYRDHPDWREEWDL